MVILSSADPRLSHYGQPKLNQWIRPKSMVSRVAHIAIWVSSLVTSRRETRVFGLADLLQRIHFLRQEQEP